MNRFEYLKIVLIVVLIAVLIWIPTEVVPIYGDDWMEFGDGHAGLAAWVQAFGAVLALGVAVSVPILAERASRARQIRGLFGLTRAAVECVEGAAKRIAEAKVLAFTASEDPIARLKVLSDLIGKYDVIAFADVRVILAYANFREVLSCTEIILGKAQKGRPQSRLELDHAVKDLRTAMWDLRLAVQLRGHKVR